MAAQEKTDSTNTQNSIPRIRITTEIQTKTVQK